MTAPTVPAGEPKPKYRRPDRAPSASFASDAAQWDALIDGTAERAVATAEKWRTGLAGFITIITSILLLKGPETAQKIAYPWNLLVIGLLVVGAITAVRGLWLALSASAPPEVPQHYDDISSQYGTVRTFHIVTATRSGEALVRAKKWVLAALIFMAGVLASWLVPMAAQVTNNLVLVEIRTAAGMTACGTLAPAKDGFLSINIIPAPSQPGSPVELPLPEVIAVKGVASCTP